MSFEWDNSLLEDCLDALIDYRGKTPVKTSSGIPLITAKVIKSGRIETPTEFIAVEDYESWMRRGIPECGDVVLTVEAPLGEVAQLGLEKIALAQRVVTLRGKAGFLDSTYLLYWLQSQDAQEQLKARATGTTVVGIKQSELRKLSIPIPPIKIQQEIAHILRVIDDRITTLQETNNTLEAIAQALFKSWFVDFDPVRAKSEGKLTEGIDEATAALFPDAFEETEFGMVLKGWQFSTISSLAAFQNGHAFKGSDWVMQGHPVIKIGNVKPLLIDFDGCSYVSPETVLGLDRFKLGRGDLLVGMTGYVGETGLVTHTEVASYLNQRVGRISTNKGLDDLGFVFAAVRQTEFKAYAESQSHGSAQANVSGADLMKFPVVIPPAQVLDKFNQVVGKLIEKILANFEEAKTLTNLRDTLLPRLISGQLRIAYVEAELEKVTA